MLVAIATVVATPACTDGGAPSSRTIAPSPSTSSDPNAISPEAREYLNLALDWIRIEDYYAQQVDWARLQQGAYERAVGAEEPSDVYPAIEWILESLGDGHGFLLPPDRREDFERYLRGLVDLPSTRRLGPVAVLELSGFARQAETPAAQAYVASAWRGVRTTAASCGWVVDLRDDAGGVMIPMLGAVEPFLRLPRPIFLDASGVTSWVRVADGAIWSGRYRATGVDYGEPPPPVPGRVAVLIGSRTRSSGEATLVTLMSGRRVRVFGTPTAGAPTSPMRIDLPDGAELWVTDRIDIDAPRNEYIGPVVPDVSVDPAESVRDDALTTARRWLVAGC